MRLTVVGCSGSLPGPDSAASCYLVETEASGGTVRLVLDLGSGAIGPLQSYVDLSTIDAVVLSHLHPDHCLDLCGFYVVRKFQPGSSSGRVPVYGPVGVAARMARAYDLHGETDMSAQFDFREYDGSAVHVGAVTVETVRVDHPVEAYALRLTADGRTLVYSGDTASCSALRELATGADLLLAEASFVIGGDNPEHLHMTGPEAATLAAEAGVGRLVLTHIPPWHDRRQVLAEATPYFDGAVDVAEAGLTLTV